MTLSENIPSMIIVVLTALLISCIAPVVHSQDEGWNLRKDQHGIRVYTRETDSRNIKEYLAVMEVESSPETVNQILDQVLLHCTWMAKIRASEVLKDHGNGKKHLYYRVDFPWPFKDRDLVVLSKTWTNTQGKIIIDIEGDSDFIPEKSDLERLEKVKGYWSFSRNANARTRIEYQFLSDAGNIPAWLVNLFIVSTPYQTMKNLQKELKKGS